MLTGYLMNDGQLLDFSEWQNYRTIDHRNVNYVFDDIDYGRDGMNVGMVRFMNESKIIIMSEYKPSKII